MTNGMKALLCVAATVIVIAAVALVLLPSAAQAYPADAATACALCRYIPIYCPICAYMVYWEQSDDCFPTDPDCQ